MGVLSVSYMIQAWVKGMGSMQGEEQITRTSYPDHRDHRAQIQILSQVH